MLLLLVLLSIYSVLDVLVANTHTFQYDALSSYQSIHSALTYAHT